jgi:hypothetical protein
VCSWVRNTTFVQYNPLKGIGRSTVEFERESLMLERKGSTTLFSIVNWVSCVKEYWVPLSVFIGQEHNFPKYPIQANGKFLVALVRESWMLEATGLGNLFSIVNWLSFLKEYCLLVSFHVLRRSPLCKINSVKWMEKHCSSCKKSMNVRRKRVKHFLQHCELS